MPEIDRERLAAKLDIIPEADREGYLQGLQARGYTWARSAAPAEPGLMDRLRAAGRIGAAATNPVTALYESLRNPEDVKKWGEAGLGGLRGRELPPGASAEERVVGAIGRYGPAMAASFAAPGAGAGAMVGSAVLRRLGPRLAARGLAGLASLGTRSAVTGAAAGLGSLAGSTAALEPNPREAARTAEDFAKGEAVGGVALEGIPAAWRLGKAGVKAGLEHSSRAFSGTTPAAWETLRQAPEKVAAYAREGMTRLAETNKPVANAMLRAQELGRSAQSYIEDAARGAGKKFESMMEYLKGDQSGVRFKGVAERVYDRMEPFIERQTSYHSPVQSKTVAEHKQIFDSFYDRIRSTLQEGMAPGEAADLLQQMTTEQRAYRGTSLSAHLAELKDALIDALPGEYGKSTEILQPGNAWNLRETRGEYKAAKDLQREAAPYVRKDEPVSSFQRIMAAGGRTAKALKKAMTASPKFADKLTEMRQAAAGAQFAPKLTENLPRTGLTGSVMLLATKMLSNPLAAAEAPFIAAGLSPRLAMNMYLAGRRGAGAVEGAAGAAAPALSKAIAAALMAARKRKTE